MKFILGTKMGMTQVFRNDGTVVQGTRVSAGPCVVTQIKAQGEDRINAVQLGFGSQKLWRLSKAEQGHLEGLATVRYLRDIRTEADEHGLKRGDTLTVKMFAPGEKVQVVGTSKGKGFQGVVKRHGFKGGPASHGHKDNLRMPGSIGAGGVQRVFKDMRMAGRMGGGQVTVKNLEIMSVDPQTNELLIKGALPGARGTLLVITTPDGKIEVEHVTEPVAAAAEPVVVAEPIVESSSVVETPAQA
jgi:large subunit ribosomal protein L3